MSPYSGTQFAMYRPANYVSNAGKLLAFPFTEAPADVIDGWKCATCSSAMAAFAEPGSLAIVTTLLISVFAFWNILRR